jgi:hypothetical protein
MATPASPVALLPERVSVLGETEKARFVIKRTPRGYRHFVKEHGGRWRSVAGAEFHWFVPGGRAELRIFEWDPETGRWHERRASVLLVDPEVN